MSYLDWIVLSGTMIFIVVYGVWQTRGSKNISDYLLGNKQTPWFTIALSIMATQASAITFLSAPGQAYTDGMRFVQFYFGLPLAMVLLSITVVPIYHKMNIYTAYEYLESRFDVRARTLAAILFLSQRGLAAGFTIFAPSLILSSLLNWDIYITNLIIGSMVVIYTVSGGTAAVSQTQKFQMGVIVIGMFIAGVMVVNMLPKEVSFGNALEVAGKMGRLNVVDFEFDLSSRYNIWTGVIGGFFLALSYFGTDQSQVQRYLTGKSVTQSRMGLLFNGMAKIPMQFLILFIGVMVYVFYFFFQPPVFFNKVLLEDAKQKGQNANITQLEDDYSIAFFERKQKALDLVKELNKEEGNITQAEESLKVADKELSNIRETAIEAIKTADPNADTNDTNYIFLNFVIDHLPAGIIGLLIAVILSASMSSTSSELNALATTSLIDIYKRHFNKDASDRHYLKASRWITVFWGIYAIIFTMFANRLGTLIEAVNMLGSLVYGTILGIFLVAFYFKKIGGLAIFLAAIVAEVIVMYCFLFTDIPYLWFNVIGCLPVIGFGFIFQTFLENQKTT
ncbi:sodium:solute symporter [Chondrinema litorale]|uniref:sodium:solute symporter n=1 Tax=Chondrinema litorale TaxID=2994555 RepID=UPI0025438A79|nr:sodium:solute symporter [Chondrinema litorale]UZR95055.1 sodium:solute symporter [Chondrinema litorale]